MLHWICVCNCCIPICFFAARLPDRQLCEEGAQLRSAGSGHGLALEGNSGAFASRDPLRRKSSGVVLRVEPSRSHRVLGVKNLGGVAMGVACGMTRTALHVANPTFLFFVSGAACEQKVYRPQEGFLESWGFLEAFSESFCLGSGSLFVDPFNTQ